MFTTLKRTINFLQKQISFSSRLDKEEAEQKALDYRVKHEHGGADSWITYREAGKALDVCADFSWDNNVTLFTKSLEYWVLPKREKLEGLEYQKVLNRVIKYLSVWGEVYLNDSPLIGTEEIKASLKEEGIEFQEVDGVIVYESTVEEERKRKNGFFNRQ